MTVGHVHFPNHKILNDSSTRRMVTTNPHLGSKWLEVPNEPTILCREVEILISDKVASDGNPAIFHICVISPLPTYTWHPERHMTGINENAHVSIDVTGITTFPGWETERKSRWFRGETPDTSISIPFPPLPESRYQQWSTECLYATSQDETSQWLCQQAIYCINRRQFELFVVCGWVWSCRKMAWDDSKIAVFDL